MVSRGTESETHVDTRSTRQPMIFMGRGQVCIPEAPRLLHDGNSSQADISATPLSSRVSSPRRFPQGAGDVFVSKAGTKQFDPADGVLIYKVGVGRQDRCLQAPYGAHCSP